MTYGNGAVVSYAYDNLDRVTEEYWNGTLKYQYFYNSEGNLAKKLDVTTNKAVNYEYDSLGRLIHSYQTNGNSIVQKTEHLYDTENRIKSQSWQLGNTTYSETYSYDPDDGALTLITGAGGISTAFGYDALKRLSYRYNYHYRQNYTYRDITSGSQTTTQVASVAYVQRPGGTSFSEFTLNYGYDNLGNIKSVTGTNNTAQNASYTYDQQGQLLTESNNKGSYTYSYDTYGNIRSVSGAESHSYTYGDTKGWCDLLTAYDGHSISYDAIGNPTNWYNTTDWTLTWQNGRQLQKAVSSGTTASYTYDVAGIRDSKTVTTSSGTTTYNYLTQNGQVVRQTWGSHTMDFFYDNSGKPVSCIYDGTTYIYVLNLQGDVIRMVTTTGATVATYVYDAWGKVISSSGSMASINPLRYRGYYYDTETGLYYLGSRYYDPAVKRFVNADGFASTGQGFIGYNMFAYCNNNPVIYEDPNGEVAWNTNLMYADGGGTKYRSVGGTKMMQSMSNGAPPVEFIPSSSGDGGKIMNSYQMTNSTEMTLFARDLKATTNNFDGSIQGIVFEWWVHNALYYVCEEFNLSDKWKKQAADVDLGRTIYDDPHGFSSKIMWILYEVLYPEQAAADMATHNSKDE